MPGFAETLNMTRFYHLILLLIAPCFAFGCFAVIDILSIRKKEVLSLILALTILVPYFLFQTNFIYEVTKTEAWSIPLSKDRMDRRRLYGIRGYVEAELVSSATWLSDNVYVNFSPIYADLISQTRILTSYGMMYSGDIRLISNTTNIPSNGVVYLNRLNNVEKIIIGRDSLWHSDELQDIFNSLDKIYCNGECEIYLNGNNG
jgi:uncharacterized membrane protein